MHLHNTNFLQKIIAGGRADNPAVFEIDFNVLPEARWVVVADGLRIAEGLLMTMVIAMARWQT